MGSTTSKTMSTLASLKTINLMDRGWPFKMILLTIKEALRIHYLTVLVRNMHKAILSKESSKRVTGKPEYLKTNNFSIMVPSTETFFMEKVWLCLPTELGMKDLFVMARYKEKALWFSLMERFSRDKWQVADAKKENSAGLRTSSKETLIIVVKPNSTLKLKNSMTVQLSFCSRCFVMLIETRSYKVQGMQERQTIHKF